MAAPPGGEALSILADTPACAHFEPPVDCATCGACCREAFDSVPVEDDDEIRTRHPDLVVDHEDGWRDLERVKTPGGTRCSALKGDGTCEAPFRCRVYAARPTACRDLAENSDNCLFARRRVGLSAVAGPPSGR